MMDTKYTWFTIYTKAFASWSTRWMNLRVRWRRLIGTMSSFSRPSPSFVGLGSRTLRCTRLWRGPWPSRKSPLRSVQFLLLVSIKRTNKMETFKQWKPNDFPVGVKGGVLLIAPQINFFFIIKKAYYCVTFCFIEKATSSHCALISSNLPFSLSALDALSLLLLLFLCTPPLIPPFWSCHSQRYPSDRHSPAADRMAGMNFRSSPFSPSIAPFLSWCFSVTNDPRSNSSEKRIMCGVKRWRAEEAVLLTLWQFCQLELVSQDSQGQTCCDSKGSRSSVIQCIMWRGLCWVRKQLYKQIAFSCK